MSALNIMVPKQDEVLGFFRNPSGAPNGPNNDGHEQHDYLSLGLPTIDSPIGSSQAQIEAAKTEQKGLGNKVKKVIGWEKLRPGRKKKQDSTPNSTPEHQEPGQAPSYTTIQTGQRDQQTPGEDDPKTTLPLQGGQETTFQAFYNTQQSVSETLQVHNGDFPLLQHSIPGSYTIGETAPHVPDQDRYKHNWSDPQDYLKSQGELPGTPAETSSVMGRSRLFSHQKAAHELSGVGSNPRPSPAAVAAANAATNTAYLKPQPPAPNGNLYTAPSPRVGTSSSNVTSRRLGPSGLPIQRVPAPPHMQSPPEQRPVQPSSRPSVPIGDAAQTWSPDQQRQPKLDSPTLERLPDMPTPRDACEDASQEPAPVPPSKLPLSPPSSPSPPPPPPPPPPPLPDSRSSTPQPPLLSSVPSSSLPSSSPEPPQSAPPPEEATTAATGVGASPKPEQEHASPSFFASPPGATDATESRIKAYLAKHGVALDPVQDALGNLTTWSDQQQDRFRRDLQAIRAQSQEVQQQQLISFEAERQEFRQMLEQVEHARQTAVNDGDQYELTIKQKDMTISQLESELEVLRKHADDAETQRKTAEAEYQRVASQLKQADDFIRKLRQNINNLTHERDSNAQEIQQRVSQIQDLNITMAKNKTEYKRSLEAKSAEYERELDTERRQKDVLASQHRAELAGLDQQWRSFVKNHEDEWAMKERQHRAELENRDHQVALLVEQHAAELRAKEDETARMEAHYKQRYFELESSIQAKMDRAQKENRVTINELRQQIASYSKDPYVPIEDAHFVKAFQELVQDVNQLASQVRLPPTIDFDPSLDPTSCLDRNARRRDWIWVRFVRSICWRVLLGGFFSLPFGFGALGRQGEGCNELRRMYQAICVMQVASTGDDNTSQAVSMLPNDKDIHIFRTLYMKRILSSIQSSSSSSSSSSPASESTTTKTATTTTHTNGVSPSSETSSSYAPLFRKNVDVVGRELYDTLHHIVNGQLNQAAVYQHACGVAYKLGILALEMGTQRARVWLETCRYGEHVSLGDGGKWKTEAAETQESGGAGGGAGGSGSGSGSMVVDLMVHPCLSRVGDGRADLEGKKVVVRGEFVPLPMGGMVNGR